MKPNIKPVILTLGIMLFLIETVAQECGVEGFEPSFAEVRTALTGNV